MMLLPRRVSARRYATAFLMVGGLLALPRSSEAYCRTTTQQVPPSYSPTRGCYTAGLFLYWKSACIGYSINSAATAGVSLDEVTSIVDTAFGTWNGAICPNSGGTVGAATSNLGTASCGEVRYNPTGPNQNLIVFRDDHWPYSDPNNTLGLTTVTFNADTGEIYDADMEINASARNLSTSEEVPLNGFDLRSVITHEAGHFLGLAHATTSSSTMFASYRPGSTRLRSISSDDIAGICEIYPDTAQRNVSTRVSSTGVLAAAACDPTPRHGLGSTCEANPEPTGDKGGGCALSPAGRAGADHARSSAASPFALAFGVALALGAGRRRRCRVGASL